MNRNDYKLFSEGRIGSMTLKSRLVRSATNGDRGPIERGERHLLLTLYRNLAIGGVGLIISGPTPLFSTEMLADKSVARRAIPDTYFEAYASVADEVHRSAPLCKMIIQLGVAGRANGIGPSDVPTPFQKGRVKPLSADEITMIVGAYAEIIARLQQSGVDGVQIHAAHGHGLLSSFLSPYTNRRTDAYGGSALNRARIIRELVSRAREIVGDFPILVKMNCTDNLEGALISTPFPSWRKRWRVPALMPSRSAVARWIVWSGASRTLGSPRSRLRNPIPASVGRRSSPTIWGTSRSWRWTSR